MVNLDHGLIGNHYQKVLKTRHAVMYSTKMYKNNNNRSWLITDVYGQSDKRLTAKNDNFLWQLFQSVYLCHDSKIPLLLDISFQLINSPTCNTASQSYSFHKTQTF